MEAETGMRSVVRVMDLMLLLVPIGAGCSRTHPQWSYHGKTGPAHWGDLAPKYAAAKSGKEQSPIDIKTAEAKLTELPSWGFEYGDDTSLAVVNNGHAVQANVPEGKGEVTIDGETFKLLQFHFHAPSEHLVDGKEYALEVHLVHQGAGGELGVVGVLIREGSAHAELGKFWGDLPRAAGHDEATGKSKAVTQFDLNKLLPADHSSYRYAGSLTTPPCSEGVRWCVLATPIEMSSAQIAAFKDLFSGPEFPDGNRRPVQPLNERTIHSDV